MKENEIENLKNMLKELENNGVKITYHVIDSLFNETQYLNYKKGIDVYKDSGKIDEVLNYIKIRHRDNNIPKYLDPLSFRIKALKEQIGLMNEEPEKFKLLRPEIEARLDELETLLDYYKRN